MKQYKITIPVPCDENWNRMTPTEKGAFCTRCEKEVIDFSQQSQRALADRLKKGVKACGRFRKDQLNTPLPLASQNSWRKQAVALGFTALLLGSCSKEVEMVDELVEIHVTEHPQPPLQIEVGAVVQDSLLISGKVRDHKGPLPGALVMIPNTKWETEANLDGTYQLRVPASLLKSPKKLRAVYIGYEIWEQEVLSDQLEVDIVLSEDFMPLGQVVVVPVNR